VPALSFEQARDCVLAQLSHNVNPPSVEQVSLVDAFGRVLAEPITADRDYPALPRAMRDGFAVRSVDVPGTVRIAGEVRAGQRLDRELSAGETVEIMTGAPVPPGADAVIMVEHAARDGNRVTLPAAVPGANINPAGIEAHKGETLLRAGRRLGYVEVAALATTGQAVVRVYRRPEVAILATGDELVGVEETPREEQIRNSNAYSLAAQVTRAGGRPLILPVARDNPESTYSLIARGLASDLLLLSGGVSAGKYDIVEHVLRGFSAEFFFDRVAIQPGQPLVFGRAQNRFVFGLPGNPASTMVTFELFARAAVEALSGASFTSLPLLHARLRKPFRHKPGLTRFLPAYLSDCGGWIEPLSWHGSGDVAALARANVFLVASASRESWDEGEWIPVLQR
jgi:molybdopterin molybdotransferase